jgi:hypothetical protein
MEVMAGSTASEGGKQSGVVVVEAEVGVLVQPHGEHRVPGIGVHSNRVMGKLLEVVIVPAARVVVSHSDLVVKGRAVIEETSRFAPALGLGIAY